jgi:hypothetical protein
VACLYREGPGSDVLDTAASAKIPNLEKLKAYDSYYSWRREQAKKNGGQ